MQTEQMYQELEQLSAELGLPAPMTFLGIEVHDDKNVLEYSCKERAHTWLRNYWNYVFCSPSSVALTGSTYGAGYLNLKQYNGTVNASPGASSWNVNFVGLVNNATYGIVVGTGMTAWSFEQSTLAAAIAHGTSSGQLSHAAQAATTSSYNASTKVWTLQMQRVFANSSGGDITINETGLRVLVVNPGIQVLFCRDLPTPFTLLNGRQLTVTYTITLTFPG